MLTAMSLKGKQKAMKAAPTKKPLIRIAVVESDPLRFAGFQALFDSEPDFELISVSLPDIGAQQNIDLVLLGNCHNLLDVMSCLKAPRPQLRIIVTGAPAWTNKPFSRPSLRGPRATWMRLHRLRISFKRYGWSAEARREF